MPRSNVQTIRQVAPTAEFVRMTPDAAAELLAGNRDNRTMRAGPMHAYADEMRAGEWLVTGESVKVDWNGRLLDGQHRLAAIIESDTPQEILVVTGLDPKVQTVIDTPVKRLAADVLRWAGLVEENAVVTAAAARIAILRDRGQVTVYGSISGGGASGRGAVSHMAILDWVTDHPEVTEAASWAVQARSRIGIAPSPMAYVYWQLHRVDGAAASQFLDDVLNLRTEGPGDPRHALLQSFRLQGADLQRRPGAIIGLSFAAWNAWRDDQRVKVLPVNDSKGNPRTIEAPL